MGSENRLGKNGGSDERHRRIPPEGGLEEAKSPGVTARLFVIQQGEKARPVYDARFINRFFQPRHFQMEDMRTIAGIIQKEDWMIR